MSRDVPSSVGVHRRLIAWSSVALLAPLLLPLVTGRVFTRDDLGALHLPFRFLYQEALQAGELLLWTPAYHSGFFLFAAGEAGMVHPLHLLLYRLLPLGPAFNLEIIGNYLLMFAGVGLLWRRLGASVEGAMFGAMMFTFSGFNLFNMMHVNHVGTFAHAPWILLAAHVLLTSDERAHRSLAFGCLALATGLQLVAGNPQYVWLTGIAVGYLILCLVLRRAAWDRVALTAAALGLGGLIGAVQLLPTLEFLQDSTRAAWSPDAALSFSLSPLNLVQLWSPFAFEFRVFAPPSEEFIVHEFVVYNGAFTTAALAWVALRYRHMDRKPLLAALLVFAGFNLLLAFGRYGGLYPLLVELPGLRSLRAPARHLLLVHLALSGVAALVLDDLRTLVSNRERLAWRRLWPLATIIVLSIATTAVAAGLAGSVLASSHGIRFSGLLRAGPWAVLVTGVVSIVMLASRGVGWAIPALIVVTAIDLGLWGYSYAYRWGPIRTIAELQAEATAPPEAQPGDLIPALEGGRDELAILRGLRLTMGYTGLYSTQALDPRDPLTQHIAGVNWQGGGDNWSRLTTSMARARLVSETTRSTNPRTDLPTIDPSRVALVDRFLELSGPPGSARVLEDRPGRVRVETTADGPQLLIVTERFHRGWRAELDGQTAEPIRVYGDFLGCVVPAGTHRVAFRFRPDSFRVGLLTTVAGLAITFVSTVLLWRRRPEPML